MRRSRRFSLPFIAVVTFLLAGCETLSETILVQRVDIHDRNGVHVWADLEEEFFGDRYWTFTAHNMRGESVCVRLGLRVTQHNGYNYYDTVFLPAGDLAEMGYIREPAGWRIENGKVWSSTDNSCSNP